MSAARVSSWRRRRSWILSQLPDDDEKPASRPSAGAVATATGSRETSHAGFAESRQAADAVVIGPANGAVLARAPVIQPPFIPAANGGSGPSGAGATEQQAAGLQALLALAPVVEPAIRAPVRGAVAAAPAVVAAPEAAEVAAAPEAAPRRRLAVPLPLVVVLTVQAVLSARILHANTAFGDEALYLWAGHLEWAHWLHGTQIPAFPTWFSGSPVIYPPLGALADSIGGLAGARILSMCFMLGATCLLWGTASRLYGRRAAFFAAALFTASGPTLHLGAFATYDAMALFLMAAAAWCACGARTRVDATGWILAAAAALALANATKYASALFDPVVVALAVLCAYPRPGGKAALRRGALFLTTLTGTLAGLLRLGGAWYVDGISQTTTMRPDGGAPVSRVLTDSWQWTAVVGVAALAGLLLSMVKRNSRPATLLLAALAAAALLVPVEQARIQTTVSLNKHVDFGAWFAAIAAGYALSCFAAWVRPRHANVVATICLSAAVIPVAVTGAVQARAMADWPGAARLIAFLRPATSHGGRFLAETDDVPEYYLPHTSWRQWSNTFSITLPDGRVENVHGSSVPYAKAISDHYFSLVILSFSETAVMDKAITRALRVTPGYRVIGIVPYGGPVPGDYTVWAYRPGAQHDAA